MSLDLNITKRLGTFTLDVEFTAPNGVTAVFGRSGAGKTTLINVVAGLSAPDSGHIALNDTPLFDAAQRINLPAHKGAWDMCSKTRAYSPTWTSRKIYALDCATPPQDQQARRWMRWLIFSASPI